MKKLTLALTLIGLASMPAFNAAAAGYTIGGVNNHSDNSQTITVGQGTNFKFVSFQFTISKGVSLVTDDADTTNAVIKVATKHFASATPYAGVTGGGSIAACTTVQTKNAEVTLPTIDGATGVCS